MVADMRNGRKTRTLYVELWYSGKGESPPRERGDESERPGGPTRFLASLGYSGYYAEFPSFSGRSLRFVG